MTPSEHTKTRTLIRSSVLGLRSSDSHRRPLSVYFFVLLFSLSFAHPAFAQDQAKRLVALLDYLGSDYKNAIKDGKILSQDEFSEMQEFSKRSLELFNQLKEVDKADKAGIEANLK